MFSLLRSVRDWIKPSADASYEWINRELGLYFTARPKDRAWMAVTPRMADLMQQGFLEIWRRGELEKYSDTNDLPSAVIDTIAEVANRISEPNNFNPAFVILVSHQYVDADKRMRQSYRSRWVAMMVSRSPYAPPPESYVKYIQETYFSNKE